MKANFLKSITTGIIGLTLLSGCANHMKNDSNSCNANGCSPKKNEKNGCKGKKECNSCHGKKAKKEANSCKGKKDANSCKGKKDAAKKDETTTTK